MSDYFFELIQVAIGTREGLSGAPTRDDWFAVYEMSKKQGVVGICFAGVQHLKGDADGRWCVEMPENLYYKWMAYSAQIRQKNEKVNRQCVALQTRLSTEGLRSCVLKGQGVAALYDVVNGNDGHRLSGLRQSGDIDMWVDAKKEDVEALALKVGMTEKPGYLHVGVRFFKDAEVELHYRPAYLRSLRHNRRLQRFCENHKADWTRRDVISDDSTCCLIVPSLDFDVVYQLSHIYRHLFGMGIGMRQLMDYYFVLCSKSSKSHVPSLKSQEVSGTLKRLGLLHFAGAVMYVMREVLHLHEQYMICDVDEKRGKHLLQMVMQTGNFGHMDKEQNNARSTKAGNLRYKCSQWMQLFWLYPEETLCAPIWSLTRALHKI